MLATTTRERIAAPAVLEVMREDIRFFSVTPKRVRIEITVRNCGDTPSASTPLHIESAALGAFLPWRPLTTLAVPALGPGEETVVATDVERTPVAPLGEFGRVPPSKLLTAVGADDEDGGPDQAATRVLSGPGRFFQRRRDPGLAPDVFELMGRSNVNWLGNLRVFVGRQSVERHMAAPLRIYGGRKNIAVFCVGRGPDAYAFDVRGDELAQYAILQVAGVSEVVGAPGEPGETVRRGEWLMTHRGLQMALIIRPPTTCRHGKLDVHVQQHSTCAEAIVEFELDASAAGPGCFVM